MKTIVTFISAGLLLVFQTMSSWAQTTNFTISATVPTATGVTVTVASVNSSSNTFTTLPAGTTALSFDPMTFNTTSNIYVPDHYFAVNFGVTGGSGSPDVTFTYNEGTNPNSGRANQAGLGTKSTATFAKEVTNTNGSTTETLMTDHGPKKRLIDLGGEHVTGADTAGGFLRVYLGVWTGSTAAPADPSNGQPFSNADAPGQYTGSLVATATVA